MQAQIKHLQNAMRSRWQLLLVALGLGALLWLASLGGSWGLPPSRAQSETGCLLGQFQVGGAGTIPGTIPEPCRPYTAYVEPCLPAYVDNPVAVAADEYGEFTVCGLPTGDYDVRVYGINTLANKHAVSILPGTIPGTIPVDFGTLLPGDATNDNVVDIADFSALSAAYDTSAGEARYDARPNFNCDTTVDDLDLELLEDFYGQGGAECP